MRIILIVFVFFVHEVSYAYEYQIEKFVLKGQSSPGHETITSLAVECVLSHEDLESPPKNCLKSKQKITGFTTNKELNIPSITGGVVTSKKLLDSSSWPDDPTRQGSFYGAKAKINLVRKCENFWSFLGYENYNDSISGGLFCNSHMGVLQFFHSQASKPADTGEYSGEEYDVTLRKILSWARFNYKIVKDSKILNEPYCGHFKKLKKSKLHIDMAESFLPTRLEEKLLQCEYNYTVDWIYNNKCTNPMSSKTCTPEGDSRAHQITALGALIHMVQDSYSQSHTKRGVCSSAGGVAESRIVCKPIEQFYDFLMQDGDKHGESDVMPISVSSSCDNSDIDDAVTSTAAILWHAIHGKSEDDLIKYLEVSVYFNPYKGRAMTKKAPVASGGDCYLGCE